MNLIKQLLPFVFLLFSTSTNAESYLAIDVGQAEIDDEFWGLKGEDTAFKISYGFGNLPDYYEVYYANFGEALLLESGPNTVTTAIHGIGFDILGKTSGDFQLFASLGVFYFEVDQKINDVSFYDDTNLGFKAGAGFSYRFGEPFSLKLNYEYYLLEDEFDDSYDVGMLSLGAMFHF